jgi:Zn-dependent protease with chaperone function
MTALDKYALLEAEGVYFDGVSARPREVVVRFGETTLTLLTMQDEPVNHWALASLRRISSTAARGENEVLRLAPGHEEDERLTLEDSEMIAAIRAVCPDLDRPAVPVSHTLRRVAIWGGLAAISLAATVALLAPMAAKELALRMPQDRAARFGDLVVEMAAREMTGAAPVVCTTPAGAEALARLTARLRGAGPYARAIQVEVLRADVQNAFAAPGGRIVLFSGLIDRAGSPEEVAAVLAHEIAHAEARDPLREAFRVIGTAGLLGLVFGDQAGGAATAALSEALMSGVYRRDAEAQADARALAMLGDSGLPGAALAAVFDRFAADAGGGSGGLLSHLASHPDPAGRAARARAADRIGAAPFVPALEDADWITLQQICD